MLLSDEIETLRSEAGALVAACALTAPGVHLPPMPELEAGSTTDTAPSTDASDAAETRRERKALAAKAARKRARKRLASLEHQACVLRCWFEELRSCIGGGSQATSENTSSAQHATSPVEIEPAAAVDFAADEDETVTRDATSMPPKKRHRSDPLLSSGS